MLVKSCANLTLSAQGCDSFVARASTSKEGRMPKLLIGALVAVSGLHRRAKRQHKTVGEVASELLAGALVGDEHHAGPPPGRPRPTA
jgi:hypothetical protein